MNPYRPNNQPRTPPASKEYKDNYDRIFKKKKDKKCS